MDIWVDRWVDRSVPHRGGGGEQPSRECEPPRVLREVERLTRNPEKLANADGRCWKDTLGRKMSFKTHRPPYPTRRGLVTAWQETKKLLHDESGRTMSGRTCRRKISKNYQDIPTELSKLHTCNFTSVLRNTAF